MEGVLELAPVAIDEDPRKGRQDDLPGGVVGVAELYVHSGHDGLPSWRPGSLEALLLMAMSGEAHSVRHSDRDTMSPCGELPLLSVGGKTLCGRQVTRWALRHRESTPEAAAFAEWARSRLGEVLQRSWWHVAANRETVVAPRWLTAVPWPLRLFAAQGVAAGVPNWRGSMESEAEEALAMVERQLGGQSFLFGEATEADAAVFGVLCCMLYVQLPRPVLSLLVQRRFPSLVAYVDRIMARWFGAARPQLSSAPEERESGRVPLSGRLAGRLVTTAVRVAMAAGFAFMLVKVWQSGGAQVVEE